MTQLPRARRAAVAAALASLVTAAQLVVPGNGAAAAQPTAGGAGVVADHDHDHDAGDGTGGTDEIDLLRADASAVRARMDETAALRSQAEATLAAAHAAVDAANAQVATAQRAENRARRKAESLDRRVRRTAVAAYVRRDERSPLGVLMAESSHDAAWRATVLRSRADQLVELLDRQEAAQQQLETQRAARAEAAAAAAAAEHQASAEVATLVDLETSQARMVSQVEDRLDAKLAEAAALAAIDVAAANQLAADEQGLAGAVAQSVAPPSGATPSRRPTPVVAVTPTPTTPAAPTPTAPPAPSPSPVTTVPSVPVPQITPVDTVVVGGFVVARSIAGQVGAMLDAARAAGLVLGGSAHRDVNTQITLRRQHCGPTDWDVWFKPSSHCSPPTAIPGRSMHEKGLALDLTCYGVLIRSRDNPCFAWLAANAAAFGLKNLPSEPWHWSTNGN